MANCVTSAGSLGLCGVQLARIRLHIACSLAHTWRGTVAGRHCFVLLPRAERRGVDMWFLARQFEIMQERLETELRWQLGSLCLIGSWSL